jgi:amino acid transporter
VSEARKLGVWDGISVVVGIVVGVSLFKVPAAVFGSVTTAWEGLGVWALGGLLSAVGALCYAELASSNPESGGDYVYLSKAYGRPVGFLFGWAQLAGILTGSIGAMAFVFAEYAEVFGIGIGRAALAVAVVVALTIPNLLGVDLGRRVQNTLTLVKVAGIACILAAGFLTSGEAEPVGLEASHVDFGFALILVLYAYGGWNDAAFVVAELREPQRDAPRVLLAGTLLITLLYLAVNGAYLAALGFGGLRAVDAPAAAVMGAATGDLGERAMGALVLVSALGAVQGLLFTGSRIYARLGRDHALFSGLAQWHPRYGTPIRALVLQSAFTVVWVVAVGTERGRAALDGVAVAVGQSPFPWDRFGGGFETLVAATAPLFWAFFLASGVALFVLRWREPDTPRPFRVPLFPLTPLVFCGSCLYMLDASLSYAGGLVFVGLAPVALGLLFYRPAARPEA